MSNMGRRYIKPGIIHSNFRGVDIKPEWKYYLKDLLDKLDEYIHYYGKEKAHYEDGMEWYVTTYSKSDILIMYREDIASKKNPACKHWSVYVDYTAMDPDSSTCVFHMVAREDSCKLEWYMPGDWDDRIFSWP